MTALRKQPAVAASLSRDDAMLWIGALLALTPLLVRAMSNLSTFPAWDLDPLTYPVMSTAITPSSSLMCDAASLLGAAVLMLWSSRRGVPANLPLILLAAIGAIAVVLHGWFLGPHRGGLDHQRIGAAWLSAILGAVAVWHGAQEPRARRLFAGVLLGFVGVLGIYGAVQVWFIHPQTVADFRADPNRVLAAHGWTPDSPMAKSFTRRITQPEASGWFGLSNVYASFAAAGLVGGLGLLIAALFPRAGQARERATILLLVLFAALGGLALALARSKGGYMAAGGAAAGTLLLAVLAWSSRFDPPRVRRVAGYVGLLAFIAPIGLFMARGTLGERLGELSLLFRSFYAQAATRIFLENPIVGVGPDGFQRAFTLAKPPLCPEEVTSPHCIPFDYLAMLGVLGVSWICVLLRLAYQTGANAVSAGTMRGTASASESRGDVRLLVLIPAAATILAAYLESPLIAPEMALVRIGGLVIWLAVAWAIARSMSVTHARVALAGAALALIAHAQIDVTASFVQSCGIWAMLIAVAAAPESTHPQAHSLRRAALPAAASALGLFALAATIAYTAVSRVRPWEAHLVSAAETVRPIADISDRLSAALSQTPPSREKLDEVVRELAAVVGHPVQPTEASVNAARAELDQRLLPLAAASLERAYAIYPDDRQPLREASRLHMRLAEGAMNAGKPDIARAAYARAVRVLRLVPAPPTPPPGEEVVPDPTSPEWHWLAVILERQAEVLREREPLVRATEARLRVTAIDPYNLDNSLRLFRNYAKLGEQAEARVWATRCLELNALMRLDPLIRGLSERDRPDVERAARDTALPGGAPTPGQPSGPAPTPTP